jgi:hypothetical protein
MAVLTFALVSLLGGVALPAPSKKSVDQPSTAKAPPQEDTKGGREAVPVSGHATSPSSISSKVEPMEIVPVPVEPHPAESSPAPAGAPTDLKIDWLSINGGGGTELTAGNIKMGVSIAQSVAGEVSAGNLKMGIGFWYGASGGGSTCDCPFAGDIDGSSAVDATDLQYLIDIVFFGATDVQDPTCPNSRSDFDCSGFSDATDLQFIIDHIFFGGTAPCDGCLAAAQASR